MAGPLINTRPAFSRALASATALTRKRRAFPAPGETSGAPLSPARQNAPRAACGHVRIGRASPGIRMPKGGRIAPNSPTFQRRRMQTHTDKPPPARVPGPCRAARMKSGGPALSRKWRIRQMPRPGPTIRHDCAIQEVRELRQPWPSPAFCPCPAKRCSPRAGTNWTCC